MQQKLTDSGATISIYFHCFAHRLNLVLGKCAETLQIVKDIVATIGSVYTVMDWASGQVVRALDCCAKHRWFEPNPRIIAGMLAHCSPSSKCVPGGNTGEAKGGKELATLPHYADGTG